MDGSNPERQAAPMVEITFSVRGREYFEGLIVSSLKRIFPRIGFLVFPIILLIGLLGVLRISDKAGSLPVYALIILVITLLLLTGIPALRAVQYSRNTQLSAPQTWRIGATRIEIVTTRGDAKVGWKSFERPTETWHLFLLYSANNNQSIYILPKHAFRDGAQMERFREIVRKACGKIR
jgi:hypothetical protein